MGNNFYVYIAASHTRTLYIGVTNDLQRRLSEHCLGLSTFTAKYRCDRIVWYEHFPNASDAIAAEEKLKGWSRAKKIALIEGMNPGWESLIELR